MEEKYDVAKLFKFELKPHGFVHFTVIDITYKGEKDADEPDNEEKRKKELKDVTLKFFFNDEAKGGSEEEE